MFIAVASRGARWSARRAPNIRQAFCSISTSHHCPSTTFKRTPVGTQTARTMSNVRDTSSQSDITKMVRQPDGSFKRQASVFRNFIEKGGKFEPEAGAFPLPFRPLLRLTPSSPLEDRYHLYVSYACRTSYLITACALFSSAPQLGPPAP